MGYQGKTPENRQIKRNPGRPKGSKNLPKGIPTTLHVASLQISKPYRSTKNGKSLRIASLDATGKRNSSTISIESRYRALREKATSALEALVTSDQTPANVRAASARTLLELCGAIGAKAPKHEAEQGLDDGSLEPEGLSLAGIEAELQRLSSKG